MASFQEVMDQLRAAHNAGDVDLAKRLAAQARALRGTRENPKGQRAPEVSARPQARPPASAPPAMPLGGSGASPVPPTHDDLLGLLGSSTVPTPPSAPVLPTVMDPRAAPAMPMPGATSPAPSPGGAAPVIPTDLVRLLSGEAATGGAMGMPDYGTPTTFTAPTDIAPAVPPEVPKPKMKDPDFSGVDANPDGTAFGRAIKRGWIRTKSTIPAWKASRAADIIREAQEGYAKVGGYMKRAEYLQEQITALEEALPEVRQVDPEAAAALSDEIEFLRQKMRMETIGAGTLTTKRGQKGADKAAVKAAESGVSALVMLRELSKDAGAIPMSPGAERTRLRLAQSDDTVNGTMSALAAAPLDSLAFLSETAAESSPQIVASAVAGLITKNPALSATILGGGTFTQEYGASVDEFLQERGVKIETAEDAAKALQDTDLMREADSRGLKRGIVIAAAEMLGQGAAGLIEKGMGPISGAVASTGVQGLTGGGGEAAARLAAGQDFSWQEVIIEAIAEVITAPVEVGTAVASSKKRTARDEIPEGGGPSADTTSPRPPNAGIDPHVPQLSPGGAAPTEQINADRAAPPRPQGQGPGRVFSNPGKINSGPKSDRYEVIPEIYVDPETGEESLTGRRVRVDTTGQEPPVVVDEPAAERDAAEGSGPGGSGSSARPAPDTDAPAPVAPRAITRPVARSEPDRKREFDPIDPNTPVAPRRPREVVDDGEPDAAPAPDPQPEAAPAVQGERNPQKVILSDEEVRAIETDADAFQYKAGGDEKGVTDALKGVNKFDPERAGNVIVYETRDGRRIIADGHQRMGLARRAAAAGQKDVGGVPASIYREVDGYTPADVRVIAAEINIANGTGTALDAAKILREGSASAADLDLPPTSSLVRDAEGLRRLSDGAFGMVANGVATEQHGAIVGREVVDQDAHASILKLLGRLNPRNAEQAAIIARDAAADTARSETADLFGSQKDTDTLYLERARVLDSAVKGLKKDKATFSRLVREGDKIEGAGNKLDADANTRRVEDDAKVLEYLQRQANTKGPISDALSKAARDLKAGRTLSQAARQFVGDVQRALSADGTTGVEGSRGGETAGPRPEAEGGTPEEPEVTPAPKPGADLFDRPDNAPRKDGKRPGEYVDRSGDKHDDAVFVSRVDELPDRIPLDQLASEARRLTLEPGRREGVEFMMLIDPDGQIVSYGSGGKSETGIPAAMRNLFSDPDAGLIAHHNHPSSNPFSPADYHVGATAGFRGIYAHLHDGTTLYFESTERMDNLLAMLSKAGVKMRDVLRTIKSSSFKKSPIFERLRNADDDQRADAWRDHSYMFMRAMDDVGLIVSEVTGNPARENSDVDNQFFTDPELRKTYDSVKRRLRNLIDKYGAGDYNDRPTVTVRHPGRMEGISGRDAQRGRVIGAGGVSGSVRVRGEGRREADRGDGGGRESGDDFEAALAAQLEKRGKGPAAKKDSGTSRPATPDQKAIKKESSEKSKASKRSAAARTKDIKNILKGGGLADDTGPDPVYEQLSPIFSESIETDPKGRPRVEVFGEMIGPMLDEGLTADEVRALRPYFERFLDEVDAGTIAWQGGQDAAPGGRVEPDSGAAAPDGVGADGVPDAAGSDGQGDGAGTRGAGARAGREGGERLHGGDAASVGGRGRGEGQGDRALSPGQRAADGDAAAGRDRGDPGLRPDDGGTEVTRREAADSPDRVSADPKSQQTAHHREVAKAVPALRPEQVDDVVRIERRFFKPEDGKKKGLGMLITNGTGTGKTMTGLGAAKRFVDRGAKAVLVVVKTQGEVNNWVDHSALVDLTVAPLQSTTDNGKDAGAPIVVTTYANIEDNKALVDREWDFIVSDESHMLMSNAQGEETKALRTLRTIANKPSHLFEKELRKRRADMEKAEKIKNEEARQNAKAAIFMEARKASEAAQKKGVKQSNVLFMSATPFAYDKNVDYAEGYLFNYPESETREGSRQDGRTWFMVENFGYRVRYHKLTQPEAAVDRGVFHREFHERLKREGSLWGRKLDVPTDYDRKFVTVSSDLGNKIETALDYLRKKSSEKNADPAWRQVEKRVQSSFRYHQRQQLLEAIKAKEAMADIRRHVDMGRKVVVFHDFNVGGGTNPFSIPVGEGEAMYDQYMQMYADLPWLADLPIERMAPPKEQVLREFGARAREYNGTVSKKERQKAADEFNRDGSGVDVIVVQSDAGSGGISLHDTTGGHKRVLINLGMPVKPTTSLQAEGRTRRVGSVSDSPYRYYTIGTTWERQAFARRIAEQSGAVENLAMGNEARAIKQSFIDAYEAADRNPPSEADGKGGLQKDTVANNLSDFDRAKSHYFGRQKMKGKRDQRKGFDFFPTPEPLGYKMAEWAQIRPYDKVLEPSAGDGAISRYFPEHADRTIVEREADLLSKAELRTSGARARRERFEDLPIVNKYDAVVMNPPFGRGGKLAFEHVEKAMMHTRPGGRVVALVPKGPAATRQFELMMDRLGKAALEWNMTAAIDLPSVTFERAGTAVQAEVMIFDRIMDTDGMRPTAGINLNNGPKTIGDFFDRLEGIAVPDRPPRMGASGVDADMDAADAAAQVEVDRPAVGAPLTGDGETVDKFDVFEFDNTKTGEKMFGAQVRENLGRDRFKAVAAVAKQHGGYYSKYQNKDAGAKRGFLFKTDAERRAFIEDLGKPVQGLEDPAYHGSIFDFDRFDTGRIGTGEGAQAFGWGLYFTQRREIAEHYRNQGLRQQSDSQRGEGRIYSVEVPDATDLMAWDVTLAEQPEKVREALLGKGGVVEYLRGDEAIMDYLDPHVNDDFEGLTGREFYQVLKRLSENDYLDTNGPGMQDAYERGRDDEVASLFLRNEGIPGHRFLDAGSRAGGEGTYNYVIYDDSEVDITLKEQRPPIPGGTAMDFDAASAMLPKLRAKLDAMNLKRVTLNVEAGATGRQGMTYARGPGQIDILISQALDPEATLYHESIHAMRAMNLFTPQEWDVLRRAAEKRWIDKHDIRKRYPDLTPSEQVEEAIAEEFSEVATTRKRPGSSFVVRAFNKIHRFLKALRSAVQGNGMQTAEDIFGKALAGQIGARDAGSTGAAATLRAADSSGKYAGGSANRPRSDSASVQQEAGLTPPREIRISASRDGFKPKEMRSPTQRWQSAMINLLSDKQGRFPELSAGRISPILEAVGVKGGRVLASGAKVRRIVREHPEARNAMMRLPELMKSPLAIIRQNRDDSDFRLVLDSFTEDGLPVVANIKNDGVDARGLPARVVMTVYGWDDAARSFKGAFDGGNVVYVRDAGAARRLGLKGEDPLSAIGSSGGNRARKGQILTLADIVKPKEMRAPSARQMQRQQRQAQQQAGAQPLRLPPHIPDRRLWYELTASNASIFERLRGAGGAIYDAVDKARFQVQDRMLPVLRAQQAIENAVGAPLPNDMNAYQTEVTYSGKAGRKLFEVDEEFTKPIIGIIAKSKGALDAEIVGQWLTARHAEERNRHVASVNPAMPDGGSGMTNAEARAILAQWAAGPQAADLQRIGDLVDKMRDYTLRMRLESGLMSARDYMIWKNQYDFYVPLKGYAEVDGAEGTLDMSGIGRRYNTRGPESMRALGRGEGNLAFNPLVAAITQAKEVAIRSEKNRVGQALYRLAKAHPSKALWTVKTPKQKRFYNRTTGLVETRVEPAVTPRQEANEFAVKIEGKEHRVVFHDQRLTEAINNVGYDGMQGVVRWLGAYTRFQSAVLTMLNPEFVVRNAFRDFQTALINLPEMTDQKGFGKAVAKNWRKAFMGVYRGMGYKDDTEWSRHYREFEESGAKISFWTLDDPVVGRSDLEKRIDLARGPRAARILKAAIKAPFSTRDNKALGWIERVNLSVDNAVRLAAFVEARKRGMSQQDAANLSKNLTVNFNRRGKQVWLNSVFLFFNAAMQGMQTFARVMFSKHGLKVGGALLTYGMVEDMVNAALSEEDDDGELAYDKIPDYQSNRNFIWMARGGDDGTWGVGQMDDAWKIPMPYVYSLPVVYGRKISQVLRGVKDKDEAFLEAALATAGDVSPLQFGSPVDMVTPTLLKDALEFRNNEDWLDRPIRPEYQFNDYGPMAYKHYVGVSELSRVAADKVNRWTGGNAARSGWLDVSPEYIDHAIGTATGSAGTFWMDTIDIALKAATGATGIIEPHRIPFVSEVSLETGPWLDRSNFFERYSKVMDAKKRVKIAGETGEPARPEHYILEEMSKKAAKLFRARGKLDDQRMSVRLNRDLTQEERAKEYKRIERELQPIYDEMNRVYLRLEKEVPDAIPDTSIWRDRFSYDQASFLTYAAQDRITAANEVDGLVPLKDLAYSQLGDIVEQSQKRVADLMDQRVDVRLDDTLTDEDREKRFAAIDAQLQPIYRAVAGAAAEMEAGIVTSVTDGDTFRSGKLRVRLSGINAPEMDEPGGEAAKQALADMIYGKPLLCSDKGKDTFGRQLASCRIENGEDIGTLMISIGKAVPYRH